MSAPGWRVAEARDRVCRGKAGREARGDYLSLLEWFNCVLLVINYRMIFHLLVYNIAKEYSNRVNWIDATSISGYLRYATTKKINF
jgi:hypothetical protein